MKNDEQDDAVDALGQVHAARHRISATFDHDPKRLIEYYMELQKQYQDRLVGAGENGDRKRAA